jgi:hypothetical protein
MLAGQYTISTRQNIIHFNISEITVGTVVYLDQDTLIIFLLVQYKIKAAISRDARLGKRHCRSQNWIVATQGVRKNSSSFKTYLTLSRRVAAGVGSRRKLTLKKEVIRLKQGDQYFSLTLLELRILTELRYLKQINIIIYLFIYGLFKDSLSGLVYV